MRVDLDDTWIELHEWRADDPIRTVVFWHGLGATASGAEFVEVGPRLAAAGLNVVAVDAPGFGASPALPPDGYRFSALGQLLQRVVDALGLEQPVLVGHSWGASVVASCAAAFPELPGALVLVDGGHLAAFQAAVPHAEVWWVRDAGHNVLVDAGPSIGDDIAEWIRAIS